MFGVVIWSDKDEGKSVIWCEDHGDLAFCRQEITEGFVDLDAGDLVQFELSLDKTQRIACNPRLVAEGVYDGITGQLSGTLPNAISAGSSGDRAVRKGRDQDKIIPFGAYQEKARNNAWSSDQARSG